MALIFGLALRKMKYTEPTLGIRSKCFETKKMKWKEEEQSSTTACHVTSISLWNLDWAIYRIYNILCLSLIARELIFFLF